ncbi:alpha-tocopherol transfer protein-like [Pieris napi]|uniref:alpha-tocopherol transfer protein-like n=1 Tax=Pieris napi TaxID=78633 RepID=UPI001FB8B0D0|nr:alpha-tocopherol transfer protein-like [Pieris napi]
MIYNMLNLRPIAKSLQEKCEKELNEQPERLVSDIKAIRDWLQKQPHLQSVKPSDQWLLSFLRGNKFSLERTKEKLDMSYTLRTLVPEIFKNRDPLDPKLNEVLRKGLFLPLKKCAKEDGCRPMFVRLNLRDGPLIPVEQLMKVAFMIVEIMIRDDDNFLICGEEVIVDLKNIGMAALSQWTPALAKKVVMSFEKALPVRMKSIHILNPPPGLETVLNLVKAFMSQKLKDRIFVYGQNLNSFHERFPQELLPEEYGGNNGTVQDLSDYWTHILESNRDWFLAEEEACSDESRRPENPKTTSSLFGVDGSFRKLDFD